MTNLSPVQENFDWWWLCFLPTHCITTKVCQVTHCCSGNIGARKLRPGAVISHWLNNFWYLFVHRVIRSPEGENNKVSLPLIRPLPSAPFAGNWLFPAGEHR